MIGSLVQKISELVKLIVLFFSSDHVALVT